jgi:Arylsulfotransferase (ASST)
MKRNRLIVLPVAIFAGILLAVAVGGCGGSSSHGSSAAQSGKSPACLPATLNHSAKLAGVPVDVSPAPETDTANPATQISFMGVPAAEIQAVSVAGQRSGAHVGHLESYSQGDGASFVPETPFDAGELVTVHATIGGGGSSTSGGSQANGSQASGSQRSGGGSQTSGAGRPISFQFRVDTPYPTAAVAAFHNPPAAPADYQSFYTMPGVQAPVLTVTAADRDPAAGDILTTNGPGPGQYGPLIYTPQGRLVWFEKLSGGQTAEDLNEQTYEGRRVLTWWKGKVLSLGFGQGEDVVTSSSYQTVARIPGGNGLKADLHDFQIAPRDVAYITAFNPIRCDLSAIKGASDGTITDTAIQEIDMKTGLVRWEWHSLDHVGVSESEVETPTDATPWDWFHINSIDLEGGGSGQSGKLFISARSTWAGYQLEGGSGRILWRLGGLKSSFKLGPGVATAWQHDGRVLANGQVTFFDDGSNPPIHHQSRAVRIALDLETHQARLVSALTHPNAPLLAASQGNMQTLASGNVVVGYGGVPAISEYAAGGSLLLDAHLPYDMAFYRAFRFPWSGRPLSAPAVLATLNNTSEETIVHASWNGATDVASWRVLAGGSTGSLAALATIPASDFESSTTLPERYARVAVQALDSADHVLGTSRTVLPISYAASLPSSGRSE